MDIFLKLILVVISAIYSLAFADIVTPSPSIKSEIISGNLVYFLVGALSLGIILFAVFMIKRKNK